MPKPFFQDIPIQKTINQSSFTEGAICYQANSSLLARTLFHKHRIILGEGYSYLANPKDDYLHISKYDVGDDALKNFLLEQFEHYKPTTPRRQAVLTGMYYNFHNDFVARFSYDEESIELNYRKLATVNERSGFCRLADMYIVDGGLVYYYNSRIVGTIEKVSQAYADPYTYHKTGRRLEDKKEKVYSHFDYTIDNLGIERQVETV